MNVPNKRLRIKYEKFVELFSENFNGAASARGCGFSASTASIRSNELLKKPEIQAAIRKRVGLLASQEKLDPSYVLRGLKEIYERCMQIKRPFINGKEIQGKYVFKPGQAIRALELIGRNFDMFSADVVVNLNVNLDEKLATARNKYRALMQVNKKIAAIKDVTIEANQLNPDVPRETSEPDKTLELMAKPLANSLTIEKNNIGLV